MSHIARDERYKGQGAGRIMVDLVLSKTSKKPIG
jgi:ribosomal protein S18 acetylase RimI-like enzyme